MKNSMSLKAIVIAAGVLLGLSSGVGCQQQVVVNHSEVFVPDDQPTAMSRLIDAQVARGARNDATLYEVQFDGPKLNSLGMAKLDAMLKDDTALPLNLWLATAEDDSIPARKVSVTTYLKDKGVPSDQIQFASGGNPATDHPAAQPIKDLDKTDTGASSGSSSGGGASADSSSGSSGSSGAGGAGGAGH